MKTKLCIVLLLVIASTASVSFLLGTWWMSNSISKYNTITVIEDKTTGEISASLTDEYSSTNSTRTDYWVRIHNSSIKINYFNGSLSKQLFIKINLSKAQQYVNKQCSDCHK